MKKHVLNEKIKESKIRLVGYKNYLNNIIQTKEALQLAKTENLDLVLVDPNEFPPVCKIMDYNKYIYKQKKYEKKNLIPKLKEIKFTPNISDNDLKVKIKQARKFLERGSIINIYVSFKGREIIHKDRGKEVLFRFLNELIDIGTFSLDVVFKDKRIIHQIRPKKS